MVGVSDKLQQFGERLASVEHTAWRSPERRAAAEDIEGLCRSLYKGIFESGSGWLDWGETENRSAQDPQSALGATIVPLLDPGSMHLAREMLAKTTLYSELSVVVTPTLIENMYLSYSGAGMDRRNYENGYNAIFDYNLPYRSLVTAGRCVFLPREYMMREESGSGSWGRDVYSAPLLQRPSQMRFLPANLSQASLGRSPFHDLYVYETLLLPYFPDAKIEDIATLASNETDSFIAFNRYLTKRLAVIGDSQSATEIQDIIDDIKYGVAQLRLEAKKVSRTKLLRDSQLAVFAVTVGALVFLEGNLAKEIAGVSGSVSILQLIQSQLQLGTQVIDLKKSDFFVPYILSTKNP